MTTKPISSTSADTSKGPEQSPCSQVDLPRYEFVLMEDGKSINRYETHKGRYVMLEDVVKLLGAEVDAMRFYYQQAGQNAGQCEVHSNREYHRGVQDGLMAWIVCKIGTLKWLKRS